MSIYDKFRVWGGPSSSAQPTPSGSGSPSPSPPPPTPASTPPAEDPKARTRETRSSSSGSLGALSKMAGSMMPNLTTIRSSIGTIPSPSSLMKLGGAGGRDRSSLSSGMEMELDDSGGRGGDATFYEYFGTDDGDDRSHIVGRPDDLTANDEVYVEVELREHTRLDFEHVFGRIVLTTIEQGKGPCPPISGVP
jgi:hypothetical protein